MDVTDRDLRLAKSTWEEKINYLLKWKMPVEWKYQELVDKDTLKRETIGLCDLKI